MHEVNNAAKDASLFLVYFQPGMSRPTWSISQTASAPSSVQSLQCRSRTSMMMTTRRRTALTVATVSRQQMLDLWIFAKSAW